MNDAVTPDALNAKIKAAYDKAKAARNDPYDRPNYRQMQERTHLDKAMRLENELRQLEATLKS